jgi:hypothetical protein
MAAVAPTPATAMTSNAAVGATVLRLHIWLDVFVAVANVKHRLAARPSSCRSLLEKRLPAVHQKWLLVAHYRCIAGTTPLVFNYS